MKKVSGISVIILSVFFIAGTSGAGELVDARKIKAENIANEITELRSERAASLINAESEVTPEVFKSVCGAVKKRAMKLAKENGLKIRHAALKNRNPNHAATAEEESMHRFFSDNPGTESLWNKTTIKGESYDRYVKPIYVEPACLACHGEKDKRPGFIKKKYPEDKAFAFKAGDLRGIIEVMVPVEN